MFFASLIFMQDSQLVKSNRRRNLANFVLSRYTAGSEISSAIKRAKELTDKKFGCILNLLGEHDSNQKIIDQTVISYFDLIFKMSLETLVRPAISLKPTQFGLSYNQTRSNELKVFEIMQSISLEAIDRGIFVWLDMENRFTTDFTLSTYQKLSQSNPNSIGIAMQANLKRSLTDLKLLSNLKHPVSVRLVRGIYDEPSQVAYDKQEAHKSLGILLGAASESENIRLSIGSHHPDQIINARKISKAKNKPIEFQFLLGAANKIPNYLVDQGEICTYYVPFGPRFVEYGLRRLKENPFGLIGLLLSGFFEGRNLDKIKESERE